MPGSTLHGGEVLARHGQGGEQVRVRALLDYLPSCQGGGAVVELVTLRGHRQCVPRVGMTVGVRIR